MKQIPMTRHGANKLREELEFLKNVRRYEIISSIKEARKNGDLRENSEYHAAREEQGFCESRIQEIETKLFFAQIIDITKFKNNGKVIFGSTVTLFNYSNQKKYKYKIVGDDEAEIKKNLVSINSPLSRSLINKLKGDLVFVNTPIGKVKYKILKVEYI